MILTLVAAARRLSAAQRSESAMLRALTLSDPLIVLLTIRLDEVDLVVVAELGWLIAHAQELSSSLSEGTVVELLSFDILLEVFI
jgi:hypothetical protein